jgi:endonuclease III
MQRLTKAAITEIFSRFAQHETHPVTELNAPNEFCLLISIVLSAQATDAAVNKATAPLYAIVDTPEKFLALGEEGLKSYIKTIGLFNSKAKNIIALCQRLVDEFGSIIPEDRDTLQTLAGVGRKTANVWLNCARQQPLMAVDTHVFRVGNRTGLTKALNVLESEEQLMHRIPKAYLLHAHHWLILHGRYTCKARTPLCNNCIIKDLCTYTQKPNPL